MLPRGVQSEEHRSFEAQFLRGSGERRNPALISASRAAHNERSCANYASFPWCVEIWEVFSLGENWGGPGRRRWTDSFTNFEVLVDKPKPAVAAKIWLSVVFIDFAVAAFTMSSFAG